MNLFLCSAVALLSFLQTTQPTTAWPQAHIFVRHTSSTPYAGALPALIQDTRFGGAGMGYTNLFQVSPAAPAGTWRELENLKRDQVKDVIVATHAATDPSSKFYSPGSAYFGRQLFNGVKPKAQLYARFEAQRMIAGGFVAAFLDNVDMAPFQRQAFKANQWIIYGDLDHRASMAALVTAFRTECIALGREIPIVVNLADPWNWTDGKSFWNWTLAYGTVADFWWDLGVTGVMLEYPENRAVGTAAYECNRLFGREWLARGGTLYLIFANPTAAAPLARDWDSPRTFICGN